MAEIIRYVLVTRDDREADHEYLETEYDEAQRDAEARDCAIIARHYVYDDSELVWTPDGSDVWPPKTGRY